MLSRTSRLTSPVDFQTTMRRGRRAGRRSLVVHLATQDASTAEPRAGFVVSRAVGGAVQRNRVKRRLRHLCREELASLPAGSLLVVRALPAAAESSYDELRADLRSGLDRATGAGARR